MNARLEALAPLAARPISDKHPLVAESPEAMESRRAEATAPEKAGGHSKDLLPNENAHSVPANDCHNCPTSRHMSLRRAAVVKSSRLNCAAGVWRYAAGYWFL
jgi:hypothetical protein